MTLDYVAQTYHLPETALAEQLQLPPSTDAKTTLRSLARMRGVSPFEYTQRVQEVLSELRPNLVAPHGKGTETAADTLSNNLLTALLVYGYPILALTVLLGAMGAPFPTALSVVVAGSLTAQEKMSWFSSCAVTVASSVVGDLAGYGIGRLLGREFLARRGRWVGFTSDRRARAELLLQQLGAITVFLSRSLISFLSSGVNLLAGAYCYRLRLFLPFDIVGRLIWSLAYLGLGYALGVAIEAAADFTSSLSGFLVSLVVLLALGFMIYRNRAHETARGITK